MNLNHHDATLNASISSKITILVLQNECEFESVPFFLWVVWDWWLKLML